MLPWICMCIYIVNGGVRKPVQKVCHIIVLSCSVVSYSATSWTIAHQAPLSMGILQARILEWVAMPPSRDPPNPGIKPRSPTLQADSLLSEPPGKPVTSLVNGSWFVLQLFTVIRDFMHLHKPESLKYFPLFFVCNLRIKEGSLKYNHILTFFTSQFSNIIGKAYEQRVVSQSVCNSGVSGACFK